MNFCHFCEVEFKYNEVVVNVKLDPYKYKIQSMTIHVKCYGEGKAGDNDKKGEKKIAKTETESKCECNCKCRIKERF